MPLVDQLFYIGESEMGEWIEYDLKVSEPGTYVMNIDYSADYFSGGAIAVILDDSILNDGKAIYLTGETDIKTAESSKLGRSYSTFTVITL